MGMFPLGTKGWHPDLKQIEGKNKRLTCREFTVFHMNWRSEDDDVNYIHFGSRLFTIAILLWYRALYHRGLPTSDLLSIFWPTCGLLSLLYRASPMASLVDVK